MASHKVNECLLLFCSQGIFGADPLSPPVPTIANLLHGTRTRVSANDVICHSIFKNRIQNGVHDFHRIRLKSVLRDKFIVESLHDRIIQVAHNLLADGITSILVIHIDVVLLGRGFKMNLTLDIDLKTVVEGCRLSDKGLDGVMLVLNDFLLHFS